MNQRQAREVAPRSGYSGRAKAKRRSFNQVTFEQWVKGRVVASLGTNDGADSLPFQDWRRFKEAFAPELVARAIEESRRPVEVCIDPFGGSGTTALACQFLGVRPITVEVNPFLADLIEAKLCVYSADELACDLGRILRAAHGERPDAKALVSEDAPSTFVEPGDGERWIFSAEVASRLVALRTAIEALPNPKHQRFFRVVLGGILIEVSNVVVSGKGRRYRRKWESARRDASSVDELFCASVRRAITEVHRYRNRAELSYELVRGDSREELESLGCSDLSVFSPPYPNSFDYTDVYNVELWALGYLQTRSENSRLRNSTLCSHVQISQEYRSAPRQSPLLKEVLDQLQDARERGDLWDRRLPEMVGGYFADLFGVLSVVGENTSPDALVWMVIGDSRYADVHIPSAQIAAELIADTSLILDRIEPFRSMRASAQQGGDRSLSEALVAMRRG